MHMSGMTLIVKNISSWVKFLIALFGIYIIVFGDFTPGGGFAGGVIIASSYILLTLAFGREFVRKNQSLNCALVLTCFGALAFAIIAIIPMLHETAGFFSNFIYKGRLFGDNLEFCLMGSGTIAIAEFAIGLIVASATFLVIQNLFIFRVRKSK